ncbi:MAG: hypothetical protein Q9M30_06855, partial [Mariprofundaceae bacterium]|nr:hypothetical protein [Mariprofundaceae bacterium]
NADRVMIWDLSGGITDGANATYMLGQTVATSVASGLSQSRFNWAKDVAFDSTHNVLWVADYNNNRIMGFGMGGTITNGMNAAYVIGQATYTSNSSHDASTTKALTSDAPTGLTMGPGGRLIVVSQNDDRVQIIGP